MLIPNNFALAFLLTRMGSDVITSRTITQAGRKTWDSWTGYSTRLEDSGVI